MIYNMFFYDKLPLDFHFDTIPQNEGEKMAMQIMKKVLSHHPGSLSVDNAIETLIKAYEMGFLPALYWCGWMYQYQPNVFLRTWYYGEKGCALMNYRKAEKYYLKAIRAGDMNAHYGLSTLYIFGNYDHSDHYVDGYPGIHLLKGFYHMHEAAIHGVMKAKKALSLFYANDIYNTIEEQQDYLYSIQVNKYRDQSGLRYNEHNELIFVPDALGLVNFECIRNDTLSNFFQQLENDIDVSYVIEQSKQAMKCLKEYEEVYLARKASLLAYDRENYQDLRKADRKFKWRKQIDDEMHQRIKELPLEAKGSDIYAIYDEYEEKRKEYDKKKRGKKMKKAIGITVTKADDIYDLGASKFFGAPTIPSEWINLFDDNELFFCQIALSDIRELDVEHKLPHHGYLYIFLNVSSYPYQPRVLYYDGEPDMVIDDFNEDFYDMVNGCDAWLMNFEEVAEDAEGIKLLGTPVDDYDEDGHRILMQYDPLASDMGFANSVDGFIYFAYAKDSDKFEDIIYYEDRS